MPDLGVLVIHGIGSEPPDFAEPMIREFQNRLKKWGLDPARVAWEGAHWTDVLRQREDELWNGLSQKHDLHYSELRRFIITNFGDAIAYQRLPGRGIDVYEAIHDKIHEHTILLRKKLGGDKPLVLMGHSLGSVILSNYVWDAQKGTGYVGRKRFRTWSRFEQLKTLCGIITFGSNLPIFTLALEKVVAIRFPPPRLAQKLRKAAKWLNFFDPDDVLGFPLKPLSPSYQKSVTEDLSVNVGNPLKSWNPMSHTEYWTDNSFTQPVARMLADLLHVL